MEEELTKKERRELKREEKEQVERDFERRSSLERWVKIGALAAIISAAGYGVFYSFLSGASGGPDLSRGVAILEDRGHTAMGTAVEGYNSNPPTSGRHWPQPAPRGVHDGPQADEVMVHNLEHGEIWISYRPGVSEDAIGELKNIAKDFHKVVLTPREKNETDIALAAWGRLDVFNLDGKPLNRERVKSFIKRYRNLGPELVP